MSDGTVTVMSFITESRSPTLPSGAVWLDSHSGLWRRDPNDANVQAEMAKAFPRFNQLGIEKPQPVNWSIIHPESIPKDRTYRNAWRHDGTTFSHDMEHARRIHLEHLRHARTEQLGALDREWMRAVGTGDKAAAKDIEAKRDALRNAPATLPVEHAQTVEELKAMWPEGLKRWKQ